MASADEMLRALPAKCQPLVGTERQARELAKVPEEKRVNVLETAAQAGAVTARSIREAAAPVIDVPPVVDDVTPVVKHLKVYVLYYDHNSNEGCSAPEDVVLSEEEADAWREKDEYGHNCVAEFDVEVGT